MKRHLFHLLLVTLILFSAKSYGQTRKQLFGNYIDKYSSIAVDEMKKHKIPASITLAQGLLESSAGQSRLAVKGNNHFGIKCSSDWKGPTIKHDDDRRGECFRKYKNAKASYEDHSRFLTTRSRYKALFKLKITDYKGWARGLKDAGYATDKQYPQKLISIIEDYKLYQYDDAKGKGKHKKGKLTVTNYHQRYITNQVSVYCGTRWRYF